MRKITTLEALKQAEIKKMSFEDVFLSPQYKADLQGLVQTACRRVGYKGNVVLHTFFDEEKDDVAFTDGTQIYVNLGTGLAKRLRNKPVLFHIFIVGLIAHELGHIFWTDFEDNDRYMTSLRNGQFYPFEPNHANAKQFADALAKEEYRPMLCRLCHQIDNVMEDIYVNALQRQMLGGLYAQGINLGNQMIAEDAISINEQKKENYPDFIIVINCLLTLLKANAVYYGKHEAEYKPRVQAIYRIARQHIFRLSHMERCDGINLMMCELWDYVEQMLSDLKKQAQQQTSQSSGQQENNVPNGQPLDEETLKKLMNEALKQIQGQTAEAKNGQTSKIAGSQQIKDAQTGEKRKTEIQEQAQDGQLSPTLSQMMEQPAGEFEADLSAGQASAAEGNGQTVYNRDYVPSGAAQAVRTLGEIISDIADERAVSANNAAVSASLQRDISDIDWGPIHKSVNKEINRLAHVPGSYRTTYAFLCRQVQPVVEKLVKTITQTLKEENLTGERRGRFYGKKLDTSRLYRTDLRVWKDRKAPKKEINLAISLLLDESGSMSGSKSEMTRLTAILFAEACEKLNIPLEINGHSTSGLFVELYNYKNFDSVDRNDKFRLVDISARGCNRDGAAVIYGCERLLKRREDKKIFIIISDGRPNHDNYGGDAAKSDLKHIRNTFARKGVTFIAAAIDADKEYIHEIYGRNFLGISHLESMPAVFGKILQKEIMR